MKILLDIDNSKYSQLAVQTIASQFQTKGTVHRFSWEACNCIRRFKRRLMVHRSQSLH